jgi:hypothetical protein
MIQINAAARLPSTMAHGPHTSIAMLYRGLVTGVGLPQEAKMKRSIALSASLITGFFAAGAGRASAVINCQ